MQIYNKKSLPDEPAIPAGKLNLLVSGFGGQDVIPVDSIVQLINRLPAFHLQGLREILYAPEFAPVPYGIDAYSRQMRVSNPKAEFIQRQRKIVFYDTSDAELFPHILYHEIGHYVFFLVIGSKVKKEWVTKIYPNSRCATDYGTLNASEDFAESYACYVNEPEYMRRFPGKYAFMRDKVFSGVREAMTERGE